MTRGLAPALLAAAALSTSPAHAADALDGATLSWPWALPFIGLLLCIATGPVLFHRIWERHYDKFALLWAALIVVPLLLVFDWPVITNTLSHTLLLEYIPFILLLLALYVTTGGIYLEGDLPNRAWTNTALLGVGTMLSSVIGTTGASMIMIRPLIRANADRRHNVHVVVFFIFLVSNIGGALSPLGDPPLFLGFLRGVDFFWTTQHLFLETLFAAGLVLAVFGVLDVGLRRRESPRRDLSPKAPLRLHGQANLVLIGLVIAAILASASWRPGISFVVFGTAIELQNLARDAVFALIAIVSLRITRPEMRRANGYSWGPIREVAVLFAGIFICIAPVMAMLQAADNGPFAALLSLVSKPDGAPNPIAYFWLTGILSSFLDNAPTYLVFFEMAGGNAQKLMTSGADVLRAISSAAVFMGAMTYIGNAPNFMVYAVARESGVRMPGFLGYLLWSVAVLIPIFAALSWLFFR